MLALSRLQPHVADQSYLTKIDTITSSSSSSSVTPVLESLACCFVSPMIPTLRAISRLSVLTLYVEFLAPRGPSFSTIPLRSNK